MRLERRTSQSMPEGAGQMFRGAAPIFSRLLALFAVAAILAGCASQPAWWNTQHYAQKSYASSQPSSSLPKAHGRVPLARPAPQTTGSVARQAAYAPSKPSGARYHVVKQGETVYRISNTHGVEVREVARLNGLDRSYTISPGQRLTLPGGEGQVVAAAYPQASGAPRPYAKPVLPPPPAPAGGFMWPVEGRIVSNFGPKDGGLHNDGINIAVPEGTPIRSAQNGVVAYVGNELRGYGNLVLVRHADGWVTAYAHAGKILVQRGEQVARGQTIALAGKTGSVSSPQIHFEVRKGSKPIDPKRIVKASTGIQGAFLYLPLESGWPRRPATS